MSSTTRGNKNWGTEVRGTAMNGIVGSPEMSKDPMGWRTLGLSTVTRATGGNVVIGTVVRSGGGTYDCTVYVEGREIGCTILQPMCATTFGMASGFVPVDGTKVAVLLTNKTAGPGYVIGVVPAGWFCEPNSNSTRYMKTAYPWDPVGMMKHRPYIEPISDSSYSLKVASTSRRMSDYVPGEWMATNEQNVGFRTDMFSATVMGGGSYVRVTRIDDHVRIRSTNLTLWTDYKVMRTFIDDGYISSEEYGCSYQSERMGEAKGKIPLSSEDAAKDRCRPRQMHFGGFLASHDFKFVMRPDDNEGDNGVYSEHISENGKSHVRAAGGISIERYAEIPLVKRVQKASDPKYDHPQELTFKPNTPFKYHQRQHVHHLELYDALAWEQKNVYRRFDEHKKDWEAKQEEKEPPDKANDPQGDREDFKKNEKRRAGVFINLDGSVVIRDAFGDEIVMNGG